MNRWQGSMHPWASLPALVLAATAGLVSPSSATARPATARPPTVDPTYGLPTPRRRPAAKPIGRDAVWIWTPEAQNDQTIGARRSFDLAKAPSKATLYVTADDHYTLFVNGERIGDTQKESGEAWRQAHPYDLAGKLKSGSNVIAIEGKNDGAQAGIVAALALSPGSREIVTDAKWRVLDGPLPDGWERPGFDDSGWSQATAEAPVGSGVWGSAIIGWPGLSGAAGYLREIPVAAEAVIGVSPGQGAIQGAGSLTRLTGARLDVTPAPAGTPAADSPALTIDFGREITGRVEIQNESSGPVQIAMSYGESEDEALLGPYTGVQHLDLPAGSTTAGMNSAYRYARIVFLAGPNPIRIGAIRCRHLFYPVKYLGSFSSSDPLLNRIWYTGAYTCHLCMQDDIWDAPKRDRARWMGDLQVSGEVINDAFLDKFLMEQTMDRLRADAGSPPHSHVNGIPGYSCAWVAGEADFYRHTGDLAYLKKHHDDLIGIMDFFRGELDDRGLFANKRGEWPYVDWSPNFNGVDPHALKATHFYMVLMLKEGSWLLREMGDAAAADRYAAWAREATAAAQKHLLDPETQTFGDRWQENAMAIYSGVATPEQARTIWDKVLSVQYPENLMITPYYNNYSIYAMSRSGHTAGALKFVRDYWGEMVKEGATTFWEGYDPRWPREHFHQYLQADNGMGYFVSLSHGWSAGATSWLTEEILGVRPTDAGFRKFEIRPNLADLKSAEGTVPTPHGLIRVSFRREGSGLQADLTIPPGTEATVALPGAKARRLGPGRRRLASGAG